MNCLHIFDCVAINPLIYTQEHITRLCKVLCWVMRRVQQDSIYAVYFHAYKLLFPKIYIKINVKGSELGTTTTNHGSVVHDLNQASPKPPPTRGKQLCQPVSNETSSLSSTSSNLFDKKPPAKDNSSSLSVPICHGQQLIKLKPPPVAQAESVVKKKHDDGPSTTTSSSVHSGMQAFELLIEDDDLYFNMKQPAITDFPENIETKPTAQHIFICNIGGTTGEDVTMEVHQPIKHQPIEQLEPTVSATPENVKFVTLKKNSDHEDEFKKCMESYNIQKGADSFDIITNAIAFYEGRYNIQLVIQISTPDSYRQYRCKQYEGFSFQISFGR